MVFLSMTAMLSSMIYMHVHMHQKHTKILKNLLSIPCLFYQLKNVKNKQNFLPMIFFPPLYFPFLPSSRLHSFLSFTKIWMQEKTMRSLTRWELGFTRLCGFKPPFSFSAYNFKRAWFPRIHRAMFYRSKDLINFFLESINNLT